MLVTTLPLSVTDTEPVCVVGKHGCLRASSSTPYFRGTDKVSCHLPCLRAVVLMPCADSSWDRMGGFTRGHTIVLLESVWYVSPASSEIAPAATYGTPPS
jgi:hypothetical protein